MKFYKKHNSGISPWTPSDRYAINGTISIERLILLTMYFMPRFKNRTKSCSSTGWTLNQPLLWFSSTQFDQFKPIEQWLTSLVGSMSSSIFKTLISWNFTTIYIVYPF